jgi:hypothetical protein
MFTSYFANQKNILAPLVPVAICASPPHWFTGPNFTPLAPTLDILMAYKKHEIDDAQYVVRYQAEVLGKLDPQEVFDKLTAEYGPDVTLLCYEKPGDFCHRRLVAGWFESNLGIQVPELPSVKDIKATKPAKPTTPPAQGSLFD